MRTVELLPDPGTDHAVRALWSRLRAVGVPGLADHPHPTNRPHLTLAEAADLPDEEGLRRELAAALPLPLHLGAIGVVHGRRGVGLHLVVAPHPSLVALHGRVHAHLDAGGADPAGHLAPGSFAPHVSLALRVPPDQLGAALEALREQRGVEGQWVAARSYDAVDRSVTGLVGGG